MVHNYLEQFVMIIKVIDMFYAVLGPNDPRAVPESE